MNVVDSSAWLEYFADGPNADFFARPTEKPGDLPVPSLTVLEVFKHVARAIVWTHDSDFEGLPDVKFQTKQA